MHACHYCHHVQYFVCYKNDYTVALETDPLSVKIIDTVTLVTSIFTQKLLREGGIK